MLRNILPLICNIEKLLSISNFMKNTAKNDYSKAPPPISIFSTKIQIYIKPFSRKVLNSGIEKFEENYVL